MPSTRPRAATWRWRWPRATDYDAIVLDLMLPGPDGFSVCRALRSEGRWVPVLMLTARDRRRRPDPRPRHRRRRLPRQAVRLRRAARAAAGADPPRARRSGRRCWRSATCAIDPARAYGHAGRPEIELTAREFDVLEFLARAPGEVVSRAELLEEVWDENYEGSPNIVDVYVGYLRKQARAPVGALIRTVRGSGFVLEAEMRLPIRVRLTAWYAVLLAAIIVGARRVPGRCSCASDLRADGRPRAARAARARSPRATRTRAPRTSSDVSEHGAARRRRRGAGARPRRPRAARPTATRSRARRCVRARRAPTRSPARRASSTVKLGREAALPRPSSRPFDDAAARGARRRASRCSDVEESVHRVLVLLLLAGPAALLATAARRLVARAQGAAAGRADDVEGRARSGSTGSTSASRCRARPTSSRTWR